MKNCIRLHAMILCTSLFALASLGACAKVGDARSTAADSVSVGALPAGHPSIVTADLPAAASQMLDSGNAAFRAKSFDLAQRYYESAAKLAPKHGAPWFGIFMVAEATENKVLADSAKAEVAKRTGGSGMPSHPDTALRNPHAALPGT